MGLSTRRANFREEALFLSTLPIGENHKDIKNAAKRNVLTNGLVSTYPFISSSIFEEEGIFYRKQHIQPVIYFHRPFQARKI